MTGIATQWVVRRYQPPRYTSMGEDGVSSLTPTGLSEQTYETWWDVCLAADTILGDNCLQMGVAPTVPVVFQQGEDVILIYMKLVI